MATRQPLIQSDVTVFLPALTVRSGDRAGVGASSACVRPGTVQRVVAAERAAVGCVGAV